MRSKLIIFGLTVLAFNSVDAVAANKVVFLETMAAAAAKPWTGAGSILIFNNGIGRNYSSVDEITPPVDANGVYSLATGAAFGPASLTWTYVATPPASFYSAEISGAQRLPNGNTLICEGVKGNLFEVTPTGEMVWRYVCPVTVTPLTQGTAIPADPGHAGQFMNAVFRVTRYAPDFPGLVGKDLTPQGTVELRYP